MTQRKRRRAFLGALTCMATGPAIRAQAPAFPNRPLRIIPFGTAGGPIETLARAYGERMTQRWGQPVIIEAKPGASGILAADAVAKAAPDGHTIMFTLPLTHINNAVLHARLPYDPVRDFEPLSQLGVGSPLLLARASAPYSDLREFIAHAKAHPGVSYGTWGIGSGAHLYGELLKRQAGINLLHVPYRSEALAFNDLHGNVLEISWANPGSARAQLQAGKVKILAVAGARRMSFFPAVPTFAEQGLAGFEVDSWIGAYAPARTPAPVLDQLVAGLREITQAPEIRTRLLNLGFEPLGNGPKEFMASYRADYPRLAELIKAAGVTAE